MKIKTVYDFPILNGHDQYESMLLNFNNVNEENISYALPDTNINRDIKSYLGLMEPIQRGNEFVQFIKTHKNEKYCVVGDYDCDGIFATVILVYALTLCGIQTTFIAPDRFETGYGMKKEQVNAAIENEASMIITVDNGIVANEAIDYAHANNLKIIVTDHHTPQGKNNADLVINPLYNEDKFKGISGATVAMKLAYELFKEFHFDEHYMNDFVMLAGLTCISDCMPMLGENRVLVTSTINYLNEQVYIKGSFSNRLAKLINFYDPKSESDPFFELPGTYRDFTVENIEFYLVPIINAVNRVIGNVNELIYDLMTLFCSDFNGVATFYYDINTKRKYMKSELMSLHKENNKKAVVEVLNPGKYEDDYSGIAGLVSSSIVENENKPALVGVYLDKDEVHFSGRSVSGFNLYEALSEIKNEHPELTFSFGGHAEALGATIPLKEVPLIENYLSDKFSEVNIEKIEPIAIQIDSGNINEFKLLYLKYWPFGNKFEFPKLYCEGIPTFINTSNSYFMIDTLGNTKIKYFSKNIKDKISNIVFKKSHKTLKYVFSMLDENNEIYLKIDNII